MARPLVILAALAAVIALFAVRLAPASLADARIAAMTKGAVHVIDAEGTIWDARAILAAGMTRMPIAWQIDAVPLVRRELHLHLLDDEATRAVFPKGDLVIGHDSVELRDIKATIPAGFFGATAGPGTASLVGGNVEIDAVLVEWAPPANRGGAQVRWRGAWLTLPGNVEPIEFGDITAMVSAEGDRLSGPVSNAGGDLAVRGTVTLSASGGIELSLVLTPRGADDRELARALSLLGAPDANGWRVEWRLPIR